MFSLAAVWYPCGKGAGLYIANDGKYAFNMDNGVLQLTLCRSAIYAQGSCDPDWENEILTLKISQAGKHAEIVNLLEWKD